MEDHKKVFSTQISIEVEVEVVKPHFEVDMEACMVDIINMKVNFMEVDKETFEEEEVEEVMEVNNQIATQIATLAGNLGTWQRTVIKGNMMHKMESCNKGIMYELVIKVMNNCL
jgi:gamma-glutamyl:cysteine ligase YbdK (ATP-grasp superfamily)